MPEQSGLLRAPEVKTSLLSPLSASFVPAASATGGEVEETCSSPPEEEAPRFEQGVRWEGASRLERIVRREEAWRLREVRRVEKAEFAFCMEDAVGWVDLLVSEAG